MITGDMLKFCFARGAAAVAGFCEVLNRLNVFPVADRDTGTNLCRTLDAATQGLPSLPGGCGADRVVRKFAQDAALGARGNSGTILSLIFSALPQVFASRQTVSAADFALALSLGEENARRSIAAPAEGTILTACREAARAGLEEAGHPGSLSDADAFARMCAAACRAADSGRSLNPVLHASQAADAGALGFCLFLDAMADALHGENDGGNGGENGGKNGAEGGENGRIPSPCAPLRALLLENTDVPLQPQTDPDNFPPSCAYCTEFTLTLANPDDDLALLRSALSPLGDCLLLSRTADCVKVHLHTSLPVTAARILAGHGALLSQKAENMRVQMLRALPQGHPDRPALPYLIADCGGDGFASLFADLNVDYLILEPALSSPATPCPGKAPLCRKKTGRTAICPLAQTLELLPAGAEAVYLTLSAPGDADSRPLAWCAAGSDERHTFSQRPAGSDERHTFPRCAPAPHQAPALRLLSRRTEADICRLLLACSIDDNALWGPVPPEDTLILDTLEPDRVIAWILARPEETRPLTRLYVGRSARESDVSALTRAIEKAFPIPGSVTVLPGGQERLLYLSFISF